MSLPLVHHPYYDADTVADGHRFPMRKYSLVAKYAKEQGRMLYRPSLALADQLEKVHTAEYVSAILTSSIDKKLARKIGFMITPAITQRACAAVGGTIYAAQYALEAGAAINLAGGSHHASADCGAGFCVFNDVAVAAEVLLASGDVGRVLIIDLDVHQGDGTARIFAGRDDVFTLSVHCEENWPTDKPPSSLDVSLPQGTPDAIYLTTLQQVLEQAFDRALPDCVFYNAGVDPHADDRLGKLALTDGGLAARDRMVAEQCQKRGLPVCGVLGGGYAKDPSTVAKRHMFLIEAFDSIVD